MIVGPGTDGTGRALVVNGTRKGYDRSQVLTPDVVAHTTCETRRALARFTRYNHDARIVWHTSDPASWHWQTALADEIERSVLRMAGKRERGLRWNVSALARSLHASRTTVQRVIKSLTDRAIVTFEATRGRYSRFVLKVVAQSIAQPYRYRDGQLNSNVNDPIPPGPNGRYWDRYSEEEQDDLMRRARLFRMRLVVETPDPEYEPLPSAYDLAW